MRDEIERADKQEGMRGTEDQGEDDNDPDTEVEGDPPAGTKVAG